MHEAVHFVPQYLILRS